MDRNVSMEGVPDTLLIGSTQPTHNNQPYLASLATIIYRRGEARCAGFEPGIFICIIQYDDDGPWGSPIVLASKPNQEHKHWSEYVFRLCVSYRALNAITRPFLFPVRRCDDAIEMVGAALYIITMDLDAGYW